MALINPRLLKAAVKTILLADPTTQVIPWQTTLRKETVLTHPWGLITSSTDLNADAYVTAPVGTEATAHVLVLFEYADGDPEKAEDARDDMLVAVVEALLPKSTLDTAGVITHRRQWTSYLAAEQSVPVAGCVIDLEIKTE